MPNRQSIQRALLCMFVGRLFMGSRRRPVLGGRQGPAQGAAADAGAGGAGGPKKGVRTGIPDRLHGGGLGQHRGCGGVRGRGILSGK